VSPESRLIVVTDRISAFDRVLETEIPNKGAVLNGLSNYWFEATRDIIENHLVKTVDPSASLVHEAVPLRVEMVVRGYLTGSMWRAYQEGKRVFSGCPMEDGLKAGQRFKEPLLTPTTKEQSDREIAPLEIVATGLTTAAQWDQMCEAARALFARGTSHLADKGILLADTKYEFGVREDRLCLIDEIHTPDSSRLWPIEAYRENPAEVEALDKEYVRSWLRKNRSGDEYPVRLPEAVIVETRTRYLALYERVLGRPLPISDEPPVSRLLRNLVAAGILRDGYVVVAMGSEADLDQGRDLSGLLEKYGVAVDLRIVSAHKNGEVIAGLAEEYNGSAEPGAVIAVAGLSNGLGGALSANLALPVINCPRLKDSPDLLINIHSSLMMPSAVPAATVIRPGNAALAALRSLNLPRLRARFAREISEMKARLSDQDRRVRGR
jgi:fusion protein PurCD